MKSTLKASSLYFRILSRSVIRRRHSDSCTVLGIETSCDDTACGIVRSDRRVLGQSLVSQHDVTWRHGGVIPNVARDLHKANINAVVLSTLNEARMRIDEVNAIAVTVKPGLVMSLLVGMEYAKRVCVELQKPFLPIHHMEAHALVCRLVRTDLDFPYLTLLVSGGHCLLAIVHSISEFILLGKSIDDAPGEAFDKVARRLKLSNMAKYRSWAGGAAIEDLAGHGNALAFDLPQPLLQNRDCNFSFSGLKSAVARIISSEESKSGIAGDEVLPNVADICASFQYAIAKHLCARLQRAIEYIEYRRLLPAERNRYLVVSGGVACNRYLNRAFQIVCRQRAFDLCTPPSSLCTDNGVMIAWNGVERFRANHAIYDHDRLAHIAAEPQCPLGVDRTEDVRHSALKCKWIRLDELNTTTAGNAVVTN